MNTSDNDTPDTTPDHSARPLGYWLKATDRLLAAEFATAFESEHASRRDWRLLSIVDGTVDAPRPLPAHKLHGLAERGWIAPEGEGWALTDDGRAAKDRLGAIVERIRAKVTDAVSAEELATTLSALEKIARAFGWDEDTPLPRGRRRGFGRPGRGFGHGFPRGFGRGFGHGPRHDGDLDAESGHREGFGPRHGDGHGHGHGHHRHDRGDHGHGHHPRGAGRHAQRAFERGFDAGFQRGRAA